MEQRLNSEKKIQNEFFKLKIGTTNRNNPKAIYIEGASYITPNDNEIDYYNELVSVKNGMKSDLSYELAKNKQFDNKFIFDFQTPKSGIKPNKKSFISFQIMLRQNDENILKMKELKEKEECFVTSLIEKLINRIQSKDFTLYKTRS